MKNTQRGAPTTGLEPRNLPSNSLNGGIECGSICSSASLQAFLIQHYDVLRRRLTNRIGCPDLAADSLQETWLRLAGKECVASVVNLEAYVFRMACNMAIDLARMERGHQGLDITDIAFENMPDSAPGPARIAESRSEARKLISALEQLPRRRQAIFIGVRIENLSYQEVAERHGVSLGVVARIVRDTKSLYSKSAAAS